MARADAVATPVPQDVREAVVAALADIRPNIDRQGFVAGPMSHRFDLTGRLGQETALLRLLLEQVLGLSNLGRFEKTAWECTFTYRGTSASIAHRKMGVALYVRREGISRVAASTLAKGIKRDLVLGIDLLERRFLRAYAQQQLSVGNVTLANQTHRLREMHEYFRDGARIALEGGGRIPERTEYGWNLFPREREAYFNSVAMVSAYFGWLEHVLTIVLPFTSETPPPTLDVAAFMRRKWQSKFTTIFGHGNNQTADDLAERFRLGVSRFRNRHVHGGLDVRSGYVAFHLPGCGPVSMAFDDPSEPPMRYYLPLDSSDFDRTCLQLNRMDKFLRTHPRSRHGMVWAESGLDVAFDLQSRTNYAAACANRPSFVAYLDRQALLWEQAVNMEW